MCCLFIYRKRCHAIDLNMVTKEISGIFQSRVKGIDGGYKSSVLLSRRDAVVKFSDRRVQV